MADQEESVMVSDEEVADVLDAAADVLLVEGWHQGGYGGYASEGVCTLGAVSLTFRQGSWCAAPGTLWTDPHEPGLTFRAANDALLASIGRTDQRGVGMWNDDPATTEDDVHDLLRSTAKRLRETSR